MKRIRKRIANRLLRIGVPLFGLFITAFSVLFGLFTIRSLLLLPKTNGQTFLPILVMGLFSLCFAVLGFNLGPRFVLRKGVGQLIADVLVPLDVTHLPAASTEDDVIIGEVAHTGPESEK